MSPSWQGEVSAFSLKCPSRLLPLPLRHALLVLEPSHPPGTVSFLLIQVPITPIASLQPIDEDMDMAMTKADFASTLIPEIVLYIVRECCCCSKNGNFGAYVRRLNELASVCHRWRSTILNTPSLWTSVAASDEPHFPSKELALSLKRAFNVRAQIDLSISLGRGREMDRRKLVEDLIVYQAFYRHVKLSWVLSHWAGCDIITLRFPAVRSLHLDLAVSRMILLDLSHSCHLESLEIFSPLRLHVGGARFHHLSSVTLVGNGHRAIEDEEATAENNIVMTIYDVLKASPHLRSLHISRFRSRVTEKIKIDPLEVLELQHIQSMTLTDLQPELLSALLRSFRCPNLKLLHVEAYSSAPPLEHIAEFVAKSRDALETLEMLNVDSRELRRSIRRGSGIRELAIDGEHYSPESARSIVADLTGRARSGVSSAICPKLRSLTLTNFDLSLGYASLETLVHSRCLPSTWSAEKCPFEVTLRGCLLSHKLKHLENKFISFTDCCFL